MSYGSNLQLMTKHIHDAVFRGGFESTTAVVGLDTASPLITFFESGADSRTFVALQSCAEGDTETSIVRDLMTWVDGKYNSIDAKLNARFEEFTRQRTVNGFDFDDLLHERLLSRHSSEPLDCADFLDMICRTGTFPIDSDETFLLIAACAQAAAVLYDGPEFAYRCMEALFVHNNRRYSQKAQRQHRVHEDRRLKSGLFPDTTAAACRRYVNRDYGDETCDLVSDMPAETRDDATGDDSWFKQISRDRVMLRGAFHFMMTAASAGSLMLCDGPMEIVRKLHTARGLYAISITAYEAALQRCDTPKATVHEFVLHGACDPHRKELCRQEFHRCFKQKRELQLNLERLEDEFLQEISTPASNQSDIPLGDFEARLLLAKSANKITQICRQYGGFNNDYRKELCLKAFLDVHLAEWKRKHPVDWVDKIFEKDLLLSTPGAVFSPYTDEQEKGLKYALEKWAFMDRQTGCLPRIIAGITADEVYSERYVRALPKDQEVIAIRSACGTGKSVACREFLKSVPDTMPIVQITHRKALSHELRRQSVGGRKAELYSEIINSEGTIDLSKHSTVIIQYESLSKLEYHCSPIVLICDEINSIFTQMLSTCGDSHASHRRFVNLLHNAEKVLFFDAFLDDDRLALINKYTKKKAHVIHNTYKTLSTYTYKFTGDRRMAMKFLALQIRKGNNVSIPCFLKSDAEAVYEYLRQEGLTDEEVGIYTGDKPFPRGEDVNDVWGDCRAVIYTTCMDCGHSFILDHFNITVCFFSNMVDIPYEIALQLMARSRKTTAFVICFPPGPTPKKKSTIISEILEELRAEDASMVQMENNLEWGYLGAYTEKYCTYIHVLATHRMMVRKSRSDQFPILVKELLMQDGAHFDNMAELEDVELTNDDIAAITLAKKTAKDKQPCQRITTLTQQYAPNTECIFVEPNMDDEGRKVYGRQQTINAFQNLQALRSEGTGIESAIENIKLKVQHTLGLLDRCSLSRNFCRNSIAQTRCELLQGTASLIQANEEVLDLFQQFTGSRDLDKFDSILGSHMRMNLGCLDLMDPKSTVDSDIRNQIAKIYNRWSDRKDLLCEKKVRMELTLTTSLTLLNHMLASQFDMRLERSDKKQCKRGGKCDFLFVLIKHKHFTTNFSIDQKSNLSIGGSKGIQDDIIPQESSTQRRLPVLCNWNNAVDTLKDCLLLSSKRLEGVLVVTLGYSFVSWPGRTLVAENESDYIGLQNTDFIPDLIQETLQPYVTRDSVSLERKRKREDKDNSDIQPIKLTTERVLQNNKYDQIKDSIKSAALQKNRKISLETKRKKLTQERKLKKIRAGYVSFDSYQGNMCYVE